jgi:hypothetical protein
MENPETPVTLETHDIQDEDKQSNTGFLLLPVYPMITMRGECKKCFKIPKG